MMAFCTNCGQKLSSEAKFCSECGRPINKDIQVLEQRKEVYDGKIYKCPNCGESLDSFTSVCPRCDYELRGFTVTSRVNDLALKLEKADSVEQKNELIRNFYIPNTKEDICEFFILAISNINAGSSEIDAWFAKMEQAYQKASLTFGDTNDFDNIKNLYNEVKKKQKIGVAISNIKKSKLLQCVIICSVGIIMVISGWFLGSLTGNDDSPFYMIAFLGLFPLFGGPAVVAALNKKDDNKKEGE